MHADPELEADVFSELDEDLAIRLLGARADEEIAAVLTLMGFNSASAGGLMGMDFIALPTMATVGDALARVRESPCSSRRR